MNLPNQDVVIKHCLAVLGLVTLAMGARGLLQPWLGDSLPFVFALPAAFLVGYLAGPLAATMTVALCVAWLLFPPLLPTLTLDQGWRPVLYFVPSGILLAFVAARLRTRLTSADQAHESDPQGTLRWLLAAIVTGGAYVTAGVSLYHQAVFDARQTLDRSARIAEENALKIFETNIALISRIADALGDDSEAQLLAREAQLHAQFRQMAAPLAQLQGVFLIGASGRMIASNRVFPAPRDLDFSDRPGFAYHLVGTPQPYVSEVLTSRTTGEPFFEISQRHSRRDGSFSATVSTSLSPGYFAAMYREIARPEEGVEISLFRADGVLLAGWPHAPTAADVGPVALLAGVAVPGGGTLNTR